MVLAQITSLGLVDAINPCTLAVQVLLLSALVLTKSKKEVILGGLLFTLTIFGMYALYGIGILQILYRWGIESIVKWILRGLILAMALIELKAYLKYKPGIGAMEMPMQLRPFAKKITQSVNNPFMAIPVAALCSILLLPCSSGPYVAALTIISTYELAWRIPLLIYYNVLFTLPMFGITGLVAFGMSPQKVSTWKEKHIKELHLVAGLLLLAVLFMV